MARLPFLLLALMAGILAVATVVDGEGSSGALPPSIYGTWWFLLLWAAVGVASCWRICQCRLWQRPAVFLLHVAFLVILAGGVVTHFTSHRGFVHLRQGMVAHQYMDPATDGGELCLHDLPFLMVLDTFYVQYDTDRETPADYVSHLTILDRKGRHQDVVSMNNIGREHGYRIFQTSYDDDCHGSLFTLSYDPWGTALTYTGYALLAIGMTCVGVTRRRKDVQPSVPHQDGMDVHHDGRGNDKWGLTPFVNSQLNASSSSTFTTMHKSQLSSRLWLPLLLGMLLASYMVVSIAFRPLMPVLRSPMLFVHVGVIMISYVLLVVSFFRRGVLPYAVFFLAAGIFLGAMWANISWGSYWSWDPKESWALITLILYSIPLHRKSLPWFRSDRNYRIYSLLCLLCLLMTYFGVTYLLGGMHSYA